MINTPNTRMQYVYILFSLKARNIHELLQCESWICQKIFMKFTLYMHFTLLTIWIFPTYIEFTKATTKYSYLISELCRTEYCLCVLMYFYEIFFCHLLLNILLFSSRKVYSNPTRFLNWMSHNELHKNIN